MKKTTLTEKLDMLMEENGINMAELARGSGIPYTTITSFYDKGTENVKLSTLKKLAKYFNCSLDFLADDDITEKIPQKIKPNTIAAHLDGVGLSKKECEELDNFIKFLLSKRN
jgi:transcriptional regulator with XRE-family HTH domain